MAVVGSYHYFLENIVPLTDSIYQKLCRILCNPAPDLMVIKKLDIIRNSSFLRKNVIPAKKRHSCENRNGNPYLNNYLMFAKLVDGFA